MLTQTARDPSLLNLIHIQKHKDLDMKSKAWKNKHCFPMANIYSSLVPQYKKYYIYSTPTDYFISYVGLSVIFC